VGSCLQSVYGFNVASLNMIKILIGGVPGVGKSTLTAALAKSLNVPWISTDQIRNLCNIEKLKNDDGFSLEKEIAKSEEIWPAVERIMHSPYPWEGIIVEGAAILPHRAAALVDVKTIFIVDDDADRVRETVYQRSLLPWINTKTVEQQVAKVEFILKFGEYIKTEAKKYGIPIYSPLRTLEDVDNVKDILHSVM
jgi:2-phosphoglycerate kinase